MDRRSFLKGSVVSAAALGIPYQAEYSEESPPASAVGREHTRHDRAEGIIDTNVYMFGWPFRHLRYGDPASLVEMLVAHGVGEAWVGSFEGPFHEDIEAVNNRLAQACRAHGPGFLVPFGTVNPRMINWRYDLERLSEEHGMPGIRLHPGYHDYKLDEPVVTELFEEALRRGLVVQVVPWLQDERHHNQLMPVPTPDIEPLAELAGRFPGLSIMVLNGFRAGGQVGALAGVPNVSFDFAKLDVITPLEGYLERIPIDRIVFGSYSPMFYFTSARLKMRESGLTDAQTDGVTSANARRILANA